MSLKGKLKKGECVLGTWCDIPSPAVSNVIAKAGLDFIIIDMEHGPMDFKVAQEMAMAAEAGGSEAIVRVPMNEESSILRSLDIGLAGIMVPKVGSARDRAQAVGFAKYHPAGRRGFNPFTRALGYSTISTEESNRDTVLAIMLEDIESINNLEAIINVPEVDVAYLGIYDLALSMGLSSNTKDPKVTAVVADAITRAVKVGKVAGCMVHNQKEADYYKKLGAKFLAYKVDTAVIMDAYKEAAHFLKQGQQP